MSSSVAMAPASAAVAVAVAAMTITTAGAKKPDSTARASRKSQKSGQSQQATAVKQPKGKAVKAEHKAASMAADAAKASSPKKSDAADTKKHSSKQSFKIAREKERKEKQLKQTGGLVNDVVTTQTDTLDAMALRLQEMEQDSVKSRNHKLFLAPSLRHSGPCWSGHQARDARFDSVAERLHEEILEYAEYTRTTVDAMTVHIEQMISHVGRCVRALWPKSRMEPFGSYSTGIWLPSSDVDLVILGVVEIHDRMLTVKSLRQLAKALEKQPWVESLVVLESAKIPVLKLVTAESSVPIDITFESTATHSGLLARDLIKRYADEMPELYPLAVVFKQLLRERDLNDAYTGGLSSYSIVLMIIHFQLLCRYGHKCFKAAALFASGSPLPRPSDLLAEEAEEAERQRQAELQKKNDISAAESDKKPSITSSFAAVVTRSKSLKRPASEVGRCGSEEGSSPKQSPAQPFSYAAVAAGIAKVAEDGKAKAAAVPSSYAAAVAAPAPKVVKPKASHGSPAKSAGSKVGANDADSISVTSSTADTEDSASCSDSSTTTSAHDDTDDDVKQASLSSESELQEPPRELSLGERTMTILEFYGILFDYRKNGLSVRDGGYIYRLADHVGASGDLCKKLPALVIEDPIHPDRNVSASSFAFSKVVAVFEDSYYALKYFRPTRFTPSALSCLLSTSGHTLHHLTKPKTPLKK